jgi:replicative DNA helicase
MNVAADVAIHQRKPVLVVSLEMTKTQLMDRLLAAVGGIPLPSLKTGECASDHGTELAAATMLLRDAPICVSDVPVMTMPRIRAIARRQANRMGGMGLVVIDYLGLMEGEGKGRTEDVTAMSRQIKLLARELSCPVIVLSQLNRGCEARPDKRPVLSDLRESGAIEQDADIVMFVYRDEVYHPNTQDKGIGEILIRKNRDGKIGMVPTAFQGDRSRFMPLANHSRQEKVVQVNF